MKNRNVLLITALVALFSLSGCKKNEPPQLVDLPFEISVTDITSRTIHVKVTPKDTACKFIWLCMPEGYFPNMTGKERAEAYVKKYKQFLDSGAPGMLYSGVQDYKNYKLIPGEEYFIIAFAYDKGIKSDVVQHTFKMADGPDMNSVSIDIKVSEVTDTTVKVTSTPSSEDFYYLWSCMPSAEFSEKKVMDGIKQMMDEIMRNVQNFDPNTTLGMICDTYTFIGEEKDFLYQPLKPSTTYTMAAVPINQKDGSPAKKIFVFENIFTTKAKSTN